MSNGAFLLLLAGVGIGIRQLTLSLPIPPEIVQRYREQQRARQLEPQRAASAKDENCANHSSYMFESEDHRWPTHLVNIDGTPMIGLTDMNGNPYGVTDDDW